MESDQPIIVIGAGRSGSSLFHDMLGKHPRLARLTHLNTLYPDKPYRNRMLMHAFDFPIIGKRLDLRFRGYEAYPFWNRHCNGFSAPCRDLVADDLMLSSKKKLRELLSKNLTAKRNRMLLKITGWPRIGLLHELYNDAKFIHVKRDGRAFAASIISMDWWHGWGGPEKWRWGLLSPEHQELWERHDRSFVALAAIQWIILMEAMDQAKQHVDESQLIEIKYEDFCQDPTNAMNNVLAFTGLPSEPSFTRTIAQWKMYNANTKWQKNLTPNQQKTLQSTLSGYLEKYGYTS